MAVEKRQVSTSDQKGAIPRITAQTAPGLKQPGNLDIAPPLSEDLLDLHENLARSPREHFWHNAKMIALYLAAAGALVVLALWISRLLRG